MIKVSERSKFLFASNSNNQMAVQRDRTNGCGWPYQADEGWFDKRKEPNDPMEIEIQSY